MSGIAVPANGGSWIWSTFGLMADAYDGARAAVSNYGPPLLQGAKQGGLKILESVGGTALLVGNTAVRGVGYVALGASALGTVVAADVLGGGVVVGGALAGGAVGAIAGGQIGAIGEGVAGGLMGAVGGVVEGAVGGGALGASVVGGAIGDGALGVVGSVVGGAAGGVGGAVVGAVGRGVQGAVTGAVSGAIDGAVGGATLVGTAGAVVGGMAAEAIHEGGLAAADSILGLSDHVDRMTLVGRLPNRPGFADAIQEKGVALEAQYQQVLAAQNGAGPVHAALTALDGALLGANATQAGQAVAMPPQDFHAALALGGHFVKQDGGALYNNLRAIQGMQARDSSHYKGSPAQQYGMDLPGGLGHLLIGQTGGGDTFFQLESHGLGNPNQGAVAKLLEGIGHGLAYVQHISAAAQYVQIGPGGCIAASEKDGQHVVLT
jgi:hypothetical protein